MSQRAAIANPIINSPFEEPRRHFRFDDEGITDEIVPERRRSEFFVPIAQPRKRAKDAQLSFNEWTADRIEPNKLVNELRPRVKLWREGRYTQDVTPVTRRLLQHWADPTRERRLFFCQIEALETLIYLTEVAGKYADQAFLNDLRAAAADANPELFRVASKMATGSGKTVVMAMLIAWQTLNKLANPQDNRFSDAFLVVAPGITIRDRLRVLMPGDPQSYYRQLDLVPPDLYDSLQKARIVIANFHAFQRRERLKASRLAKQLATGGDTSAFTETEGEMVRRVCRGLGNKRNIVVLNDEAHHCYRHRVVEGEALTGDDRRDAEKRNEAARVWIGGLEAVKRKIGVKTVYDLSATPFFLRGSGYREGHLFPWVVSDFSLIDAIESGIVKVPRVPVADNSLVGDLPKYRDLWLHVRDGLPKKGRGREAVTGEPRPPAVLEAALQSLYANYEEYHRRWERNEQARADGLTPPVFIVVCNNTNVSKLVFDYIAGWEKALPGGETVAVPGRLTLFSNVESGPDGRGRFSARPNTILVDSEQLESGEALSTDFKQIAAREIEEFKAECRARFPGRDVDDIPDEDLLREVMNTVGKPGKLGEQIRCVVSVSMLTEGWDANTVTHVLGIRAFGTQLLCEQVVGRALRRTTYSAEVVTLDLPGGPVEFEAFPVEYAEVYGVPFSFIPTTGAAVDPRPGPIPTHVRALPERAECAISFPRLDGYRYDLPAERLEATFTPRSRLTLSTADVPTKVEVDPIVGEKTVQTLDELKNVRLREIDFRLARGVLERYFRDEAGAVRSWLFPDLVAICRRWREECLHTKDDTFPQLVILVERLSDAADRIYHAIATAHPGEKRLLPIPKPYDELGSTAWVRFDTVRSTWRTAPEKCHVSHVVVDSNWEHKLAQTLEDMDEVLRYVKNDHLGFAVPYTIDGQQKNYLPDFLVYFDDGRGPDDPLQTIVEVTGRTGKPKEAKTSTAEALWIPAVNNAGHWGRWAFLEIKDPWDAAHALRAFLNERLETAPDGATVNVQAPDGATVNSQG